jgi:hypothetical protein
VQEPISPELALIDPELARSLAWAPAPRPAWTVRTTAPPERPDPGRRSQGHVSALALLLLLSLGANGYLLARAVVAPTRPQLISAPTAAAPTETAATPQSALPGRRAAEQAVLSLVVQNPAGRLPVSLINRATGLAKNNLQAACRSSAGHSFLCLVRPANHTSSEGLYVRYRPLATGKDRFTSYPYRRR